MHLFYHPGITGNTITLNKTESLHCTRVLRLKHNDTIYLTDGTGKFYRCTIRNPERNPERNACLAEIVEVINVPGEREYRLSIAISPTKSNDRFEWFLEKSTEIGVDRIIPLLCKNSERRKLNTERLNKVLVSAIKQSLKAYIPVIDPFTSFENLLSQELSGNKFIATSSAPPADHLAMLCKKNEDTIVLVGPEGDFTHQEKSAAEESGFIPVSLGKSRLRTETAGVVACHTVNLINSMQQPESLSGH